MTNDQADIPLQPQLSPVASALEKIDRRYERMREDIAFETRRCEKSLAQAHYRVGKAVLGDPTVWARVAPLIEAQLAELGPARKHVDRYAATTAALRRLRDMMP